MLLRPIRLADDALRRPSRRSWAGSPSNRIAVVPVCPGGSSTVALRIRPETYETAALPLSSREDMAQLPVERVVDWLRALGETLQAPDASKGKADVMHAIYDRITVAGPKIVGVRLT